MVGVSVQERILCDLMGSGLLNNPRLLGSAEFGDLRKRGVTCAVEGEVTIGGRSVMVRIGVDRRFPLSLPIVSLSPPDSLGLIPHVDADSDGFVCYAQSEGLLLDSGNPLGILVGAIERAKAVLEAGIAGKNHKDFMDELGAYWSRVADRPAVDSYLLVNGVLREIYVYKSKAEYVLLVDGEGDVRSYFNGSRKSIESLERRKALYVPLTSGTPVQPPRRGRLWNLETIRTIVRENLPEQSLRELEKLGRKAKSEELVILEMPRPSGGVTLIGLLFRGVTDGYPLLGGQAQDPPIPLEVKRYDPEYLVPRSGGRPSLRDYRVLIAGCGSIGGHVALSLARSGIGRLTLVDPDVMKPENTFKHVLGNNYPEQPKVQALRYEIEAKVPYISVATHQQYVELAVSKGIIKLSDFDLVVFATGNPTVELYLNGLLHQDTDSPQAVFCWIEPYGIGGHAILTKCGARGCLQCLYTPTRDDESAFRNRADFAKHGQFFGKDDLGCGSLYTPYGAVEAEKTAVQAASLALDSLMGREQGSPLLSWKGCPEEFLAAGFELSSRYDLPLEKLHELRSEYINPQCPVCGGYC